MYCKNCGAKLPYRARFCAKCGEAIDEETRVVLGSSAKATSFDGTLKSLRYLPGAASETLHLSSGKQLRAVVCVILSLLLLMTNWVVAMGRTETGLREVRSEVGPALFEAQEYVSEMGINLNWKEINKIVYRLVDGKLSPSEMFGVCKSSVTVLRQMIQILQMVGESTEGSGPALACLCLYMLLFLGCVFTGIATLVLRILNRRGPLHWVYFGLQATLLVLFIALCIFLRRDDIELELRPTVTAFASVGLAVLTGPGKAA